MVEKAAKRPEPEDEAAKRAAEHASHEAEKTRMLGMLVAMKTLPVIGMGSLMNAISIADAESKKTLELARYADGKISPAPEKEAQAATERHISELRSVSQSLLQSKDPLIHGYAAAAASLLAKNNYEGAELALYTADTLLRARSLGQDERNYPWSMPFENFAKNSLAAFSSGTLSEELRAQAYKYGAFASSKIEDASRLEKFEGLAQSGNGKITQHLGAIRDLYVKGEIEKADSAMKYLLTYEGIWRKKPAGSKDGREEALESVLLAIRGNKSAEGVYLEGVSKFDLDSKCTKILHDDIPRLRAYEQALEGGKENIALSKTLGMAEKALKARKLDEAEKYISFFLKISQTIAESAQRDRLDGALEAAQSGGLNKEQQSYVEKTAKQVKSMRHGEASEYATIALQQYVALASGKNDAAKLAGEAVGNFLSGNIKKGKEGLAKGFEAIAKMGEENEERARQAMLGRMAEIEGAASKIKWVRIGELQQEGMTLNRAQDDEMVNLLSNIVDESDYHRIFMKKGKFSLADYEKHEARMAGWMLALAAVTRAMESETLAAQAMASTRFSGSDKKELAKKFESNSKNFINMAKEALEDARKGNQERFRKNAEKNAIDCFRERADIISDTEGLGASDKMRESLRAITSVERNAMLSTAVGTRFSESVFKSAETNYGRVIKSFLFVDDEEAPLRLYRAAVFNFGYARKLAQQDKLSTQEQNDLAVLYKNSEKGIDYVINRDVKATESYHSALNTINTILAIAYPIYGLALMANHMRTQYQETGAVRGMDVFLFAAGAIPAVGFGAKLARAGTMGARAVQLAETSIGISGLVVGTVEGVHGAYEAYKAGKGIDAITASFATLYPVGHVGISLARGRLGARAGEAAGRAAAAEGAAKQELERMVHRENEKIDARTREQETMAREARESESFAVPGPARRPLSPVQREAQVVPIESARRAREQQAARRETQRAAEQLPEAVESAALARHENFAAQLCDPKELLSFAAELAKLPEREASARLDSALGSHASRPIVEEILSNQQFRKTVAAGDELGMRRFSNTIAPKYSERIRDSIKTTEEVPLRMVAGEGGGERGTGTSVPRAEGEKPVAGFAPRQAVGPEVQYRRNGRYLAAELERLQEKGKLPKGPTVEQFAARLMQKAQREMGEGKPLAQLSPAERAALDFFDARRQIEEAAAQRAAQQPQVEPLKLTRRKQTTMPEDVHEQFVSLNEALVNAAEANTPGRVDAQALHSGIDSLRGSRRIIYMDNFRKLSGENFTETLARNAIDLLQVKLGELQWYEGKDGVPTARITGRYDARTGRITNDFPVSTPTDAIETFTITVKMRGNAVSIEAVNAGSTELAGLKGLQLGEKAVPQADAPTLKTEEGTKKGALAKPPQAKPPDELPSVEIDLRDFEASGETTNVFDISKLKKGSYGDKTSKRPEQGSEFVPPKPAAPEQKPPRFEPRENVEKTRVEPPPEEATRVSTVPEDVRAAKSLKPPEEREAKPAEDKTPASPAPKMDETTRVAPVPKPDETTKVAPAPKAEVTLTTERGHQVPLRSVTILPESQRVPREFITGEKPSEVIVGAGATLADAMNSILDRIPRPRAQTEVARATEPQAASAAKPKIAARAGEIETARAQSRVTSPISIVPESTTLSPAKIGYLNAHAPALSSPAAVENALIVLGDKGTLAKNNIRKSYSDIAVSESIGGNAGDMGVAVNGYYDPVTNRIIIFGNFQHLPESIIQRGKQFTIHQGIETGKITIVTGRENPALRALEGMQVEKPLRVAQEATGTSEAAPQAVAAKKQPPPVPPPKPKLKSPLPDEESLLGTMERVSVEEGAIPREIIGEVLPAVRPAAPGEVVKPLPEAGRLRGEAEATRAKEVAEHHAQLKDIEQKTPQHHYAEQDYAALQGGEAARLAARAGMDATTLAQTYNSAYAGGGRISAMGQVLHKLGIFKNLSEPELGIRLISHPEIFDLVLKGNLENRINSLPGFEGGKVTSLEPIGGARGALRVNLEMPKGNKRTIFVKMEDVAPTALGNKLAETAGLIVPEVVHSDASGQRHSYKISHKAQDGRVAEVGQQFGFVVDVRDFYGQTKTIGLPGGLNMEKARITGAVPLSECFENPSAAFGDPRSARAARTFWRMMASPEGREEIFAALYNSYERSRRVGNSDRKIGNMFMMVAEGKVGGKTVEKLTFHPFDNDGVGLHLGPGKEGSRIYDMDFATPVFGRYKGYFHGEFSGYDIVHMAVKASKIAFESYGAGNPIREILPSRLTIEEVLKPAFSEKAKAGGIIPNDSPEVLAQRRKIINEHEGKVGYGHDPFGGRDFNQPLNLMGQKRHIIDADGRLRIDAQDKKILADTLDSLQKYGQTGKFIPEIILKRYVDYLMAKMGTRHEVPPELKPYEVQLAGIKDKIAQGAKADEVYLKAAKEILEIK